MNQTTAERERYETREKYLHDIATWQDELEQMRAKVAHEQAEKERERAEKEEAIKTGLTKRIHFCERLLGRTVTADTELCLLADEELERLAAQLETEVSNSLPRKT